MPRGPMPRMRRTALPACAPRVRSDHWEGRCAGSQRPSAPPVRSLSRAAAASPTAAAPGRTALAAAFAAVTTFLGAARGVRPLAAAFAARTVGARTLRLLRHALGLGLQRLLRQAQAPALIALEELHLHAIALLDDVLGLLGAAVPHLGDVKQALGARHDLDECTECRRALDDAFVRLADDRLGGERHDHLARALHRLATDRGDRDRSRVVDADLGARLVLDAADRLPLRPDEITDLLGADLHGDDARRVWREVCTRLGERLLHLAEDVQPALAGLVERLDHDLEVETLNLDVHLDGRDPVLRSGD